MLQDAVEPLDEPCEQLAETVIPANYVSQETTDASTQVQGMSNELYSASNSSTQTPDYWNVKGTQTNTRVW